MCDHPNATREDYLDHIGRLIDECGWAVQAVERYRFRPPYAYTIGLTAYRKPELIVTGLPARRSAWLLNDVATHILHAEEPRAGEPIPLVDGPLIQILEVDVPGAHLPLVSGFFDGEFRALQVVHADDRGKWPWEVGYRGVRGGQPVLGARSRDSA
jgi:hypothetical protein